MSTAQRFDVRHGDCLVELPRLVAERGEGCIDLVLTDPPYGIGYNAKRARDFVGGRSVANDERPFVWWMHHAAQILRDPGALICFCRWDVQEIFRLAIIAAGLDVRGQLVWDRIQHSSGDTARTFAPQHDVMWFATKGGFTFPGRRPKSVLSVMRPHHTAAVHPTEKPVPLLVELVSTLTPAAGVVLDPFCGSGSTGEASLKCGRTFIGIELEGAYAEMTRRRCAEAGSLFLG
jgi:DNA modification methylase